MAGRAVLYKLELNLLVQGVEAEEYVDGWVVAGGAVPSQKVSRVECDSLMMGRKQLVPATVNQAAS